MQYAICLALIKQNIDKTANIIFSMISCPNLIYNKELNLKGSIFYALKNKGAYKKYLVNNLDKNYNKYKWELMKLKKKDEVNKIKVIESYVSFNRNPIHQKIYKELNINQDEDIIRFDSQAKFCMVARVKIIFFCFFGLFKF